jgi:glycosyltransferase involved in cell wall biosynthesis
MPTLSIVIPCYNEEETLVKGVERVRAIAQPGLPLEIIIVDDCSRDKSLGIARDLAARYPEVKVFHHAVNQGKGAALRTGFRQATGDYVAVQDADLEYDPRELIQLLEPLTSGAADMVVGSRFLSGGCHRVLYFWHSMGNALLTLLSNMFTDLNLTDMETCYKVFRREVIQSIPIEENRFGFEPEIVAKVAQRRLRIYEMGISYHGRTYDEGKKIGWRDGVRALYCILRYNASSSMPTVQALYQLYAGLIPLGFVWLFGGMAAAAGLSSCWAQWLSLILTSASACLVASLLVIPLLRGTGAALRWVGGLLITAVVAVALTRVMGSWGSLIWLFGGAFSWKIARPKNLD